MAQFQDVPMPYMAMGNDSIYDTTNNSIELPDDEISEFFSSQNLQPSDFTFSPLGLDNEPEVTPSLRAQQLSNVNSWGTTNAVTNSVFANNLGDEYPTWDDSVWDQFLNLDLRSYGASVDGAGLQFPSLGPTAPAKNISSTYQPNFSDPLIGKLPLSGAVANAGRSQRLSRSPTIEESVSASSTVPQLSPASNTSHNSSPSQTALTPDAYSIDPRDYFADVNSEDVLEPSSVAVSHPSRNKSPIVQPTKRKRKNSVGAESEVKKTEAIPKDNTPNPKAPKKSKKAAHNTVEKRYRQNLNSKIAELRDSIPTLRTASTNDVEGDSESETNTGSGKTLRKGQILSHATDYIRALEHRAAQLRKENEALRQKMAHVRSVADDSASDPAGMVSIPLETSVGPGPQRAYKRAMKGTTSTASQRTPVSPRSGVVKKGGKFGNVLMGTLAGLTVFEGIRDQEQSGTTTSSRGLFALPVQLLEYLSTSRAHVRLFGLGSFDTSMMNILRILILFGVLLSILSSWMSPRTENQQTEKMRARLNTAAPSLTSPLADRQRAWLTAIQSVWVPQRNFFLEVCAVWLKLSKIMLRWLVGWQGYAFLTGTTQEDEAARIKAWDIAIDAQLSGGDTEICNDRVLLTFLASMTLPSSSSRLTLKAVHLQILLWRLESSSWLQLLGVRVIAMNLTSYLWDSARQRQHTIELAAKSSPPISLEQDALPNHLYLLLQQPSEEVFTEDVMRRAYNLAWNRSTRQGVAFEDAGMDAVVQDNAILTPLNAVAAWWSSATLREVLLRLIGTMGEKDHHETIAAVLERLSLAARIAPPSSNARLRALVAIAVFQDADRHSNIAAVVQTIDAMTNVNVSISTSSQQSSNPISGSADIRVALRCALFNATQTDPSTSTANADLEAQPSTLQQQKLLKSILSIVEDSGVELLGFAAACSSLEKIYNGSVTADDNSIPTDTSLHQEDVEELAAVLRILVGGDARRRWGLGRKRAARAVTMCLEVCKRAAGVTSRGEDVGGHDQKKADASFIEKGKPAETQEGNVVLEV